MDWNERSGKYKERCMDEEESGGMMDEDSSKERSEEGREENDQGKTGRYC